MTLIELLTLSAAAWYVAYAVVKTSGPFAVFKRVRDWRGGRWHGRRGLPTWAEWTNPETHETHRTHDIYDSDGLLDCIICAEVWASLLMVILWYGGASIIVNVLGVAGLALWVHGFTHWRMDI